MFLYENLVKLAVFIIRLATVARFGGDWSIWRMDYAMRRMMSVLDRMLLHDGDVNPTLEEIFKPDPYESIRYTCVRCGRNKFDCPCQAHKCNGNYRKGGRFVPTEVDNG